MDATRERRVILNDATLFGPGSKGEWAQFIGLILAIAAVAALASTCLGYAQYDYAVGAAAILGGAFLALLVLGPSWIMLTVFLVFMIASHQFRSFAILPAGGVEWHPRELLLFVLLAHLGAKLVLGKADLRPDIMHYFFFLYCVFFAHIAARGLLTQTDIQSVIAECRFPIFLGAYFVFVACVRTKKELRYYIRLVYALAILIALAGSTFFLYTLLTGNVINEQTALGEYVRRQIGPYRLQSIRPNGHLFFEIGLVVMVSMLFCPSETWRRKVLYLAVMALFAFAILITMMRTAYIALFLSLAILFILFLPKQWQVLAWFLGAVGLAVLILAFGLQLYNQAAEWIPGAEVSLKGRFVEIEGGLTMFKRNPIYGTGMGGTFEGMGYVSNTTLTSVVQTTYQSVHNVWVYYAFKGGLIGLVLVTLGLGGMAVRAYNIIPTLTSQRERFFMRGLLAAFIGQLIASLAMPRLTYPIGGVLLSMFAAAFVIAARTGHPQKD